MDANKAVELGFADEILQSEVSDTIPIPQVSMMYSPVTVTNFLKERLAAKCRIGQKAEEPEKTERSVDTLMERLALMRY